MAELQGVMSGFDWRLDGRMGVDRRHALAVDQDVERAAADLHADEMSRQLDRCRHLGLPSLGFVCCCKVNGSAPRAGDGPFPVEHRGHRPPFESIDAGSVRQSAVFVGEVQVEGALGDARSRCDLTHFCPHLAGSKLGRPLDRVCFGGEHPPLADESQPGSLVSP